MSNENVSTSPELYLVVRNHEEQYSVWRAERPLPPGWGAIGEPALKEDCLSRIDEIWTDMRPLSLRVFMEERNA